jgi:hypothetical protein
MADPIETSVTLQSGAEVSFHIWNSAVNPQSAVFMVAPGTVTSDWDEFASFLPASQSVVLADVSSSLEILMSIWELGLPVTLIAQGETAVEWIGELVAMAPGAAESIVIADGELSVESIQNMHAISTLILRGRQGSHLSHEAAVVMHDAMRHSTLIEPENCGDFPAKDNADAAASALKWFLAGSGHNDEEFSDQEPVDPKG